VNQTNCNDHTGHCAKIDNLQKNVDSLWIKVNAQQDKINEQKVWVVGGMGSLLAMLGKLFYDIIVRHP